MSGQDDLQAHLSGGFTTVCRCWAVTRRDGTTLGFTDHDETLAFEGQKYLANSGMTARAVERTTGLAVDNSEAFGVLGDPAIREADVRAGLYDGAEVTAWQVNWADVAQRRMMFRGTLGEIERSGGGFRAELRGLAEALNVPQGRVYQKSCSAVLGDAACGIDLDAVSVEAIVREADGSGKIVLDGTDAPDGTFAKGWIDVIDGSGAGLRGVIRRDRLVDNARHIEMWDVIGTLSPGDRVRLIPGCDKSFETCREKFANGLNFRGFPDIPGEDWLMSYPVRSGGNDGGSLRR